MHPTPTFISKAPRLPLQHVPPAWQVEINFVFFWWWRYNIDTLTFQKSFAMGFPRIWRSSTVFSWWTVKPIHSPLPNSFRKSLRRGRPTLKIESRCITASWFHILSGDFQRYLLNYQDISRHIPVGFSILLATPSVSCSWLHRSGI